MRKAIRTRFIAWMLMGLLLVSIEPGCGGTEPSPEVDPADKTSPPPQDIPQLDGGEDDGEPTGYWEPFNFQAGQHFKYRVTRTTGTSEVSGWFSVEFHDEPDNRLRIEWEGEMGSDDFSSSVIADQEDAMAQMMFGLMMVPSASPIVTTLLAPWWGIFFVGHQWEVGSGWSFASDKGSSSFEIVEKRIYAGVEGFLGRWSEDGQLKAEICVSPSVPLALLVRLKGTAEDYESELIEYRGAHQ